MTNQKLNSLQDTVLVGGTRMEWRVSETTDIITNKKYPLPTVRMSQQKPPRKNKQHYNNSKTLNLTEGSKHIIPPYFNTLVVDLIKPWQ